METAESPYMATLEDAGGVPTEHRMRAETRYSAALQKALAGPENVITAFRAFEAAEQAEGEMGRDVQNLAKAWQVACGIAQQAGMRDLGEDTGAYFEIRVA